MRLFDAGRVARTGADPNLIVGGAGLLDNEGAAVLPAIMPPNVVAMMSPSLIGVVGAAPAAGFGAVEPLTEEAAEGGVCMLGAAPAAGFGGVGLDTGILNCVVTLVDEHGDVWSLTFMGRISSGKQKKP